MFWTALIGVGVITFGCTVIVWKLGRMTASALDAAIDSRNVEAAYGASSWGYPLAIFAMITGGLCYGITWLIDSTLVEKDVPFFWSCVFPGICVVISGFAGYWFPYPPKAQPAVK